MLFKENKMTTVYNPFRDMDRVFNQMARTAASEARSMPMDLYRDGDEFIVKIDEVFKVKEKEVQPMRLYLLVKIVMEMVFLIYMTLMMITMVFLIVKKTDSQDL